MIGKNILITGANGYIGSSLTNKLSSIDCNLLLLSRTGNILQFKKKPLAKIKIIKTDITHENVWSNLLNRIDIIFHLAGQTSSQIANKDPLLDYKNNVLPLLNLINTCNQNNYSPDIIFAGTVTEFGLTDKIKINEKNKDQPLTIYDIHKLTIEKYLQFYSNHQNKRAVTLRLPNIYGPGVISSQPDRGIVNMMINQALNKKQITIFGNGNYIRDYLFIDDVVSAFIKTATHFEKTKGNYYVIGTEIGHTILQMARIIKTEVEKLTGQNIKILFAHFPKNTSPIEYRNFIANSSKFKFDTNWSAIMPLKEGIKITVNYFFNYKNL